MNRNTLLSALIIAAALTAPVATQAQTSISEDFTKANTTQAWWFFNGACLTGSTASGVEPTTSSNGHVPGCTTIQSSYYNENLVGGQQLTNTTPDTSGQGALRFTNGQPGGFHQNGGIVSTQPFPTGQGVSITFKTVTYLGNSGGAGGDGADGISFFLMDASQLDTSTITGVASGDGNGLGAWGGSLGYSCSNSNTPYNGLRGGYVAVGIDEFGNFLNGTTNTLGESGTTASGDNTASGGGYQPGRIGLRGAGNVSWKTLHGAYGTDPGSSTLPYYPSSLLTSCAISGGTLNPAGTACQTCPANYTYSTSGNICTSQLCASGVYNANTGLCESCASGTYNAGANDCPTTTCSSGTYNSTAQMCETCPTGGNYDQTAGVCGSCAVQTYTNTFTPVYSTTNNTCSNATCAQAYGAGYTSSGGLCKKSGNPNKPLPTAEAPSTYTSVPIAPINGTLNSSGTKTSSPTSHVLDYLAAVKNTCATGTLYNYGTPSSPGNAGATSLTNTANTGNSAASPPIAPILDYAALPAAYVVLPSGTQIANEAATQRSQATPIFYQLKISQNGLLSLSYATCPPSSPSGCSAYQSVIKSANITTANGPLPQNFLFGFAGSTGGVNNIHEILCFKADPATSAAGSAGASEKQSAKLENGIQAYFAYYNPSNGWTGRVTASSLGFDTYGNIIIANVPNWDASCVLTGGNCSTTGQTAMVAQAPANRTILSWNGSTGIPLAYTSLSSAQQSAITAGDVTGSQCNSTTAYAAADRVNYLSGDRSCEISTTGVGLFRRRSSVLGDVMDSSPIWVGVPDAPYPAVWVDRLQPSATPAENLATSANTYPAFVTANLNRTQVVYAGSNDGLVHGFRSGYFNLANAACTASSPPASCFTNNDGLEEIAYMPGAVVSSVHSSTTANVDYSNAQYGHNYFVDATPYAGDLFYNGQWHTWLVGGLGPGGAAIYALDVTNPGTTTASGSTAPTGANAFKLSGAANPSLVMGEWSNNSITCYQNATCGTNLGNTYGTPQIRRLHDGNWGIIFGNGLGSASGDAGIFVGVVNPTSAALTFYYLSTNTAGTSNGIAFVTPADLDGDHITDYVYAGDLSGNVWRFDLTSASETSWALTPGALFKTASGQPITSQIAAGSGAPSQGQMPQLMLIFGTGQRVPVTNTSGATYASAQQSLYGVWDWNLSAWNASSSNVKYATLPANTMGTLGPTNLNQQLASIGASGDVEINTNTTICWYGQSFCAANNTSFGWYMNLPNTNEQIIYNPELVSQAITVNSVVPANNSPTSCSNTSDTGFTYVMNAMTGGAFNQVFLPPTQLNNPLVNSTAAYTDTKAIAMQTNATGSSFVTSNASGISFLVYETNQVESGNGANGNVLQGGTLGLNLPPNTVGHRLSWVELR
jgi:type IV pilus assembly protein PilY1